MSTFVRQAHRWISMLFVLTVIANFAFRASGEPPAYVTYSPLLPLFLLIFSGIYLFVLPFVSKRASQT